MKNPIDNPIEDVLHELSVYRTIVICSGFIIAILSVCLYRYIQYSDLQQGRIENLEMANNSKNYMK